MSYILNTRTMLGGAAAALILGLAMSGSAQAGATSQLAQCKASSRGAAVACCQEVVNNYGAPAWLGGRDNCNRNVSCGGWGRNYKCGIILYSVIKSFDQNKEPNSGGRQSISKR